MDKNKVHPEAAATSSVVGAVNDDSRLVVSDNPHAGVSPSVPANMQEFATERCETPREMLARTLGRGEKVVGSFEVYFQGERLTRAEYWYQVITTCGVIILIRMYNRFMTWLCCKRVEKIHYKRGCLVITNCGRVISWAHEYEQKPMDPKAKDESANGLPYKIVHETKIFNIKALRQMSLQVSSPELGGGILDLCPCLVAPLRFCGFTDFEAGITLSFHSFDDSIFASDPSGLVTAGSADSFIGVIKTFFGGMGKPPGMPGAVITTITITASNEDFVHNLNGKTNPVGAISDLNVLQSKLNQALKIKPSFQGIADAESANIFSDDGNSYFGTTIVDLNGNIKIPRECVPLLAGEYVIDSKSFVYKLNFYDWFRLITTAGYAYCCGNDPIRPRRFQRAVLLLTNCRIVSIYIYERAGAIPEHLTNFAFSATSYFPGVVKAGSISCDGVNQIESSLLCDGGRLTVKMFNMNNFCTMPINCCPNTFPVTSLDPNLVIFARRMQQVDAKSTPLELQVKQFEKKEKDAVIGILDEGALQAVAEKAVNNAAKNLTSVGNDETRAQLSKFESDILPLHEGEKLVNRFRASTSYAPCCEIDNGVYLCPAECCCCTTCCTCGIRPFVKTNNSIVTSHAIYHLAPSRTYPWCCVKSLVPASNDGFVMAWAPIRSFKGQVLSWTSTGILPKHEKGVFGGKYKKTPGPSGFKFTIMLDRFSFEYTGSKNDRNWLVDDELNYEQHVFSELQLTLLDIESGGGSRPPLIASMDESRKKIDESRTSDVIPRQ